MMEEELIKIWQSSPNQERIKFEKSRLILDVQSSMDKIHEAIKARDRLELIAVVVIIPAFLGAILVIPHLLSRIASGAIIGWALYVAYRIREAKKYKPGDYSENFLDYLYKTKHYLNIQKQMIDSVLYWYILPGFTLTMLFALGFAGQPGKTGFLIKMAIGNVILAIVTYWLNKRAVKSQFIPKIEKVDELIKLMQQ